MSAWTYEQVMAKLGDEAQAVPGAIVVFRDKHIEVARVSLENGFSVTDAGRELLGDLPADEVPKKSPASKRDKKAVESANTSAHGDTDLG